MHCFRNAALDEEGRDSGQLSLNTGSLSVSDIQDSATSRDISVGVSANINDPFEQDQRGANTPVVDGSYASSDFRQDTKGTIGEGSVTVGGDTNSDALGGVNRDVDSAQVVTKDRKSGFTVYADESAIREAVALAKGDTKNSQILSTAEALADDPLAAVKDALGEIGSLFDSRADSGALEGLIEQVKADIGISVDVDKRTQQNFEAALDVFEGELGRPATEDEKDRLEQFARNAVETGASIRGIGLGNIDALSEDGSASVSQGAIGSGEELVITAGDLSTGDRIIQITADAGQWLNEVPEGEREAVELALDTALGGPVKAVAGYVIGKGIEAALANSPEAQEAVGALVKEAGVLSIDTLSPEDQETVREDADRDLTEIGEIFTAATTILGVDIPGLKSGKKIDLDKPEITVNQDIDAPEIRNLPSADARALVRRNEPGVASHGGDLPTIREGDTWLKGSDGNAAKVPSQVAEKLAGRKFNNFDELREAFWEAAADDPVLSKQFDPRSLTLMKNGRAPYARLEQQVGGRAKYELDHNQPISNGGNVYDLNNIIIRTPLNHIKKGS